MPKQECREAGGRDRIEIVKIASCRAQNQNPFSPWLVHHDEALMLSTRGGMPDLYVFERAGNPEIRFEPKTFKGFFKLNQRQGSTGASFSFCCWRELLSANAVRLWALPLKDNDLNLQNVTYLPSPCEAARANVRKPSSGRFLSPESSAQWVGPATPVGIRYVFRALKGATRVPQGAPLSFHDAPAAFKDALQIDICTGHRARNSGF